MIPAIFPSSFSSSPVDDDDDDVDHHLSKTPKQRGHERRRKPSFNDVQDTPHTHHITLTHYTD